MAITLTELAAREVKGIVKQQVDASEEQSSESGTTVIDKLFLRVGVKGGGCSGFSYTLGFDDEIRPTDQINDAEGVRVVCDPKSFLYLNGTVVDFEESLMGRGFKFTNPNASKSCGCGESFSV